MAEEEGFLGRWSRLKQQARAEPEPEAELPAEAAEAAVDPASLPALDSLGPESDYTPFLQAGVPAELKSQALRQAWVSDKAIAEFRGLNDYDWDFNAPGYGQLWALDDVKKLAERIIGGGPDEPAPEGPAKAQHIAEAAPLAPPEQPEEETIAADQPASEPAPATQPRRRHGGAVPS